MRDRLYHCALWGIGLASLAGAAPATTGPATRPTAVDRAVDGVENARQALQQARATAAAARSACLVRLHATPAVRRADADLSAARAAEGDGWAGSPARKLDATVAYAAALSQASAVDDGALDGDPACRRAAEDVRAADRRLADAGHALAAERAEARAADERVILAAGEDVRLSVDAMNVRGPSLVGARVHLDSVTFNAAGLASVDHLRGVVADGDARPEPAVAPVGLWHRSDWVGLTAIGPTGAVTGDVFLPAGPLRDRIGTWLDGRPYKVTGRIVALVREGRFGIVVEAIEPAP